MWGDDPTVNALQQYAAQLFGMGAGLFCPTGTMTNQIAIKVHTHPGEEVLCADTAHIYCYEGGGMAFNSGVQAKLLPSDRGRITAAQVEAAVNPDDVHFPPTTLVCLENTTNKGGGAIYSWKELQGIHTVCRKHRLKLHLDGARLFNALVEAEYSPQDLGALFDSISICLSKGLGCPVGSLLLGSHEFIRRARRIRKILGGGMRQAGFLAAAGLYALQHHVTRLREDHQRAQQLAQVLAGRPFVKQVLPVETNIVIFELNTEVCSAASLTEKLKTMGVLGAQMSSTIYRFVTHLDLSDEDIEQVCDVVRGLASQFM